MQPLRRAGCKLLLGAVADLPAACKYVFRANESEVVRG